MAKNLDRQLESAMTSFPIDCITEDDKWEYSLSMFGNAYKLDGKVIHPTRIIYGLKSSVAVSHIYDEVCQCQPCLRMRIELVKDQLLVKGYSPNLVGIMARRQVEARPFA